MAEVLEDWSHLIMVEYAKDSWALGIIDGSLQDDRYMVVNDLIIYKGRIFLTPGSKVKNIVLRSFHDSPLVGHRSISKPINRFWRGSLGRD